MPRPVPAVHLEILEPRDRTQVYAGHAVHLRASASAGSHALDDHIRWRSSLDGFLGRGGDLVVQLTEGKHTLRAAVRLPEEALGRRRRSRTQADDSSQAEDRSESDDGSQTEDETDTDDSDGSAKEVVEVYAVPVDYPGGDT